MKPDLSPYLAFDGCARDALEFYATVLGGEPVIETYGDFRPDVAAENQDLVLYGVLRSPHGFIIRATDVLPNEELRIGNNHYLCLNGDDQDLLQPCWNLLAESASAITVPLEQAPWGDLYGQLVDQFGIIWQINIGDSP